MNTQDRFAILTKRKALRKGASEEQIYAAQQKAKTMEKLIAETKGGRK